MPANGVHHIDLAVADLERSLVFYRELLGPLGWSEEIRYPTYRATEDVVYLTRGDVHNGGIGLRPADGGKYRYYDVGVEHIAFEVDRREEVEEAHARCVANGASVHFAPEEDRDEPGYYAFFVFAQTVFESRSSAGRVDEASRACSAWRLVRPSRGSASGHHLTRLSKLIESIRRGAGGSGPTTLWRRVAWPATIAAA